MTQSSDVDRPISIDGPGRYVFDAEANVTATSADQLPALD
jgi:hypothetical protein